MGKARAHRLATASLHRRLGLDHFQQGPIAVNTLKHCKTIILIKVFLFQTQEVNNCACINPGRLVKGTSNGTYAHLTITPVSKAGEATADNTQQAKTAHNVSVVFNKI
jgi:hypothetical protein